MRTEVRGTCAFALALAVAAGARAHDPAHGTSLVWESDSAAGTPLIVTNRGIVFHDERDEEVAFSLRCRDAYGGGASDQPGVFFSASDDGVVIGIYSGVYATSDRGCSTEAGTGLPDGESLSNLVRVAGPPARLLVSTRTFTGTSGVYASEDDGRTFTEAHRNPTDQYYDGLITAPSDPLRVYAAGRRADQVNKQLFFLCSVSVDGGTTWQDQVVPTKLVPFAVHPRQPDVVFAYQPVDRLETVYRVLRSEDRGASFTPVLEYCPPLDADAGAGPGADAGADGGAEECVPRGTLSMPLRKPTSLAATDGALWLGIGDKGGLFRSTDDGLTFEQVHRDSVQSVTCLTQRGERLWMCANMAPNTSGVWYSDDGGESFEELMTFPDVTSPVMCEDLEAQVLCSREWYDFDLEQRALAGGGTGSDPEPDAGMEPTPNDAAEQGEAGASDLDAGVQAPRRKRSSGCQVGRVRAAGGHLWWLALGLYLVRRVLVRASTRGRRRRALGRG